MNEYTYRDTGDFDQIREDDLERFAMAEEARELGDPVYDLPVECESKIRRLPTSAPAKTGARQQTSIQLQLFDEEAA